VSAISVTQEQVVNATSATFTVYAKQGSGATDINRFAIRNVTSGTNLLFVDLDYSTGAITYVIGSSGASAKAVGNGWWRVELVIPSGITSGNTLRVYAGASGGTYPSGAFAYIWGAQLEAGAFATSYIPTVASQVTRAADSASMIGNNFARWYRQDEGTAFVDVVLPSTAVVDAYPLRISGASSLVFGYKDSGATVRPITGTVAGEGSLATRTYKASGTYSFTANEKNGAVNGTVVAITETGTFGQNTSAVIGGFSAGAGKLNGTISRIAYYPRRLTNTELSSITS
jgi:hypothetical protein